MATRALCRPLIRSARRVAQPQLSFSSSSIARQAQESSNNPQSNHEKYTHFGFENVKEEEKEHKGMAGS